MSQVLQVQQLSVRYGGVQALTDVDLEVGGGQLVGLIGPNGAGKTTLIDAASGFAKCSGRVAVVGEDVTHLPPHERARRGLGRTWQSANLFDDLTVRENLRVASSTRGLRRRLRELRVRDRHADDVAEQLLVELGLDLLADRPADKLTQGQRKLVGVARALASEPHVVCLDEPAAGLDTTESVELGKRLRAVVGRGVAMLLVDHDMGLVLSVCDHVVVLNFGKVIARGDPEEIRRDSAVIEAYLGVDEDALSDAGALLPG